MKIAPSNSASPEGPTLDAYFYHEVSAGCTAPCLRVLRAPVGLYSVRDFEVGVETEEKIRSCGKVERGDTLQEFSADKVQPLKSAVNVKIPRGSIKRPV